MPRHFPPVIDHLKLNGLSCLFLQFPTESPVDFWTLSRAPDMAPYTMKVLRNFGNPSFVIKIVLSAYAVVANVCGLSPGALKTVWC